MLVLINGDDLRAALKEIEAAERNGFYFCQAVFEAADTDGNGNVRLRYTDMCEKAHPTRPDLNWGRKQGVTSHNRFDGARLVPLGEASSYEDEVDPKAAK